MTLAEAFEGCCHALGLADRSDPLVELVAKSVIAAAKDHMGSARDIQIRALQALSAR